MENLLVSACLMGYECKYCGGSNILPEGELCALRAKYRLIPVCPESAGGLSTPRDPSERLGDKVVSIRGRDVTEQYNKGAAAALYLVERYGCKAALLKARSPSCGKGLIYDGTFTGTLVPGDGVTTQRLQSSGITVYNEDETTEILNT